MSLTWSRAALDSYEIVGTSGMIRPKPLDVVVVYTETSLQNTVVPVIIVDSVKRRAEIHNC